MSGGWFQPRRLQFNETITYRCVVCRISIRFFLPITFRRTVLEQPVEQINTMRQRMSPAT